MPKAVAAIILAGLLALSIAPARCETATPDDTARFLAGLPPAPGSELAALTKDPLWQWHARHFDSVFEREESAKLANVRAFAKTWLTEKHPTMLYMFSGPDFLYATSLFPGASTYVLSGLEPVGQVPQLSALSRATVARSLRNLETSLGSLLSYSFFITRKMKSELQAGPVYGTLPILYVFLARTGKTIHEVSFVSLSEDGSLLPPDQPAAEANAGGVAQGVANQIAKSDRNSASRHIAQRRLRSTRNNLTKGVKIVFSDGNGRRQTLYYFSTNLADDSVSKSGFLAFCDKLGVADSFLKSASYLMHGGGFSKVRNFILSRSATILQDDSGIPLVYFDPKQWRLQPFGRYLGPIAIFGLSYQVRLRQLFRNGNAIPINFGLGYRWRKNESNLLLARKIAPATSASQLAPH